MSVVFQRLVPLCIPGVISQRVPPAELLVELLLMVVEILLELVDFILLNVIHVPSKVFFARNEVLAVLCHHPLVSELSEVLFLLLAIRPGVALRLHDTVWERRCGSARAVVLALAFRYLVKVRAHEFVHLAERI